MMPTPQSPNIFAMPTHIFVDRLVQKGFTLDQAGAVIGEMVSMIDYASNNLSTKDDIKELRNVDLRDIKNEIKDVRSEIKSLREEFKSGLDLHREEFKSELALHKEEFKSELALHKEEFKSELALHKEEFKSGLDSHKKEFKSELDLHKKEFKSELDLHRKEFKSELDLHRAETKAEIKELRTEIGFLERNLILHIDSAVKSSATDIMKTMIRLMLIQSTIFVSSIFGGILLILRIFGKI